MARFVCFGEILLRLTAPDHELLLQSPRLAVHVGGAEANVAVSLARYGHDARMLSVAPDNPLGQAALGELRRWGVDTAGVKPGEGRMGLYFLTPAAGPRPSEVLYDRADSAFARAAPNAINWDEAPAGADWLHVSGITPAVSANAAEAARLALRVGRHLGVRTSFDSNFRAKLWQARGEDPVPLLAPLFWETMLLFASARDIALITGEQFGGIEEAARVAFDRFPNLQLIASTERTVISADHHELGGVLIARDGAVRSPVRAAPNVVDRIGAGDAFAAGVLHGLASGFTDQATIDFAVAAAVLKHYIPGDFNLATAEEVQAYLAGGAADVKR